MSDTHDGKALRLKRKFKEKYAMSVKDVCRFLRVGERQARRYIARLESEGAIYVRYKVDGFYHYSHKRKS
jgi:predicted ArsR family transcriptional regulator